MGQKKLRVWTLFTQCEKSLIPNVFVLCKLLIVNYATPCTPERSFPITRRLKTWLRSSSLDLLNVHKELRDKLDLVKVSN